MSKDAYLRRAWDEAVLGLVVTNPSLKGESLLAAVINEANDALARLKEDGFLGSEDES